MTSDDFEEYLRDKGFTVELLNSGGLSRAEFQARRDLMLPGLERLGFGVAAQPRGAFYIYADSSQLGPDSRILAERLLADAGVAATPGLDFGSNEPRRHMRFAYTVEQARIAEGLARMEKLLA